MAISLTKVKKQPEQADGSQLTNILIGLGWKEVQASGGLFGMFKQKVDVDLDAVRPDARCGRQNSKPRGSHFL